MNKWVLNLLNITRKSVSIQALVCSVIQRNLNYFILGISKALMRHLILEKNFANG